MSPNKTKEKTGGINHTLPQGVEVSSDDVLEDVEIVKESVDTNIKISSILKEAQEMLKRNKITRESYEKVYNFLEKRPMSDDLTNEIDTNNFIQIIIKTELEKFIKIINNSARNKLNYIINNINIEKFTSMINLLDDGKLSYLINNCESLAFVNIVNNTRNFDELLISIDCHSNIEIKEIIDNDQLNILINQYSIKQILKYKSKILEKGKMPWYVAKNKSE